MGHCWKISFVTLLTPPVVASRRCFRLGPLLIVFLYYFGAWGDQVIQTLLGMAFTMLMQCLDDERGVNVSVMGLL